MSLSDPNAGGGQRPINPAGKFFIQWQGKEAYWYYYDKEATNADPTKKGANIPVANMQQPLKFIVLDQLNCIKGFNAKTKEFIYSNEVRNTKTDLMECWQSGAPVLKGLYNDIKELANGKGGDYVKSTYIAFRSPIDGKLCIGNIVMTGASLGSWIEFTKTNDVSKGAVTVTGFTNGKVGSIDFVIPTYSLVPLAPETLAEAIRLDAEVLQPYLNTYLAMAPTAGPIVQPTVQQQVPVQQPVNNFGGGQIQTFVPQQSLSNQPPVQNGFGMNPVVQQPVVQPVQQVWNPNGNNVIPDALQDNPVNTGIIPVQDDLPF